MTGVETGIATVLQYAANDSHGYVLGSGSHKSYAYGTDCAGLARLYAAAVEGVAVESYPDFGTWNEKSTLTARGWRAIKFSKSALRRGDLLLRALGDSTGHTVVWLGSGRIVGAEGDWDGKRGDGSGTEVCERSYYDYGYNWILRPPAWCSQKPEGEAPKVSIKKVEHGIYRLYNPNNGQHFLMADHNEAETLAGAGWAYEGVAFLAADSGEQVYRLYNPASGEHLPTADCREACELVCSGWVLEGRAWLAPTDGADVYRLYNPNNGQHLHTASKAERESLEAAGWTYERVAFGAYLSK